MHIYIIYYLHIVRYIYMNIEHTYEFIYTHRSVVTLEIGYNLIMKMVKKIRENIHYKNSELKESY